MGTQLCSWWSSLTLHLSLMLSPLSLSLSNQACSEIPHQFDLNILNPNL